MSDKTKKSGSGFSFRKLIYNDKYLIVISVIAAVIIWIATSMNLSPETSKTISVPIKADFTDSVSEQMGIKCYGESSINIDVTVKAKKYLAKDISADNIDVTLQTNTVSTTGTHEIPITVAAGSSDFTVESYYPTTYKAYFDIPQEQEMEVQLDYNKKDYIADGYVGSENILSESSVIIKGPKAYVSRVNKVVADVNINDKLSKTTSIDVIPKAVDVYGNTVDYITVDSSAKKLSLTIPVLKVEDLKVSAKFVDIPEGVDKSKISVRYSTDTINAGVLEDAGISSLQLGEISYSKLGIGANTFKFDVTKLDGITVLDGTKSVTVTVTVSSDYKDSNVRIKSSDVSVMGLPEEYKASVTSISTSAVTIAGERASVSSVKSDNIVLSCDLTPNDGNEPKLGSQKVNLNVSVKGINGVWVYGEYTANVYVSK